MDVRIAHTVVYLLRCPRSSVPEAIWACKFTLDKSASQSKQMMIRRSFAKKATGGKFAPPPPPRSYRHGDSCNDDSVAADKSNVYGQRRSINADNDAAEDTDDADNSWRYAVRGRRGQSQGRG